ncbi:MAG: hypothetical protein ACI4UU_05450 [Clostridia bacterium]
MKKSKKNYAIIALIVILLALAIGYAAFGTQLTINGTAEGTGDWDVHFKSVKLKQSDGQDDTTHGTVSFDETTATVEVNLAYPGDAVLLEAVVENSGTVPAKLNEFTVTGADKDLLITETGAPAKGEKLAANGGTCTSQYVIKWATDSTETALSKTFTITFDYTQDTTEINITPNHQDA